jgi:maleate isomerase
MSTRYGTKLKIGLLIPSSNTTMEPDLYSMAPDGITIHSTRMKLNDVTPEALYDMAKDVEKGADLLSSADMDVIIYGCTSGSLIGGVEWEEELVKKIRNKSGIDTISTGHAVMEALDVLGGGEIGVATPYVRDINILEKRFLESHGFDVPSIKGLGLTNNLEIGRIPENIMKDLVLEIATDVDIIFISCTNLPVIHIIDEIEDREGVPVVTSNQASLWAVLKGRGFSGIKGYGKLMENL